MSKKRKKKAIRSITEALKSMVEGASKSSKRQSAKYSKEKKDCGAPC